MKVRGASYRRTVVAIMLAAGFLFLGLTAGLGAVISSQAAISRMSGWMQDHPVMRQAVGRAVQSVTVFPEGGADYVVYVVAFEPTGYVVLNSDDRLPLAVAFSADSTVSLDELSGNAFRAALAAHVGKAPQILASIKTSAGPDRSLFKMPEYTLQNTQVYGPYLETSWGQCNPYNLNCPADPAGSEYYGYRAPSGCTPTVYAQILYHHRWPARGIGTHAYTDDEGEITGQHAADFSVPFGWGAMRPFYNAYSSSQPGDTEVADLMYRLCVAADADFESGTSGTSSSIMTLGQRVGIHLFYEMPVYRASQAELLGPLKADIQAGFPAVVSIPGHAVVADGLMTDGATDTFHINYGWGGQNDGWWSADGIPGGALSYGCTSLKPALLAFPTNPTVAAVEGMPVELNWFLPKRREHEASKLLIRNLAQQSGTWSSSASSLSNAASAGWSVNAEGRSGDCWYAGPNGYAAVTLSDEFVPDAATSLSFWMKVQLPESTWISVLISADAGQTYTSLLAHNGYSTSFQSFTIPLGDYAGQRVRLRFELSRGAYYYANGGVWLDDLSVSSGAWFRWEDFAEDTTLASRRFSEQQTLLDDCADFSVFELTTGNAVYKQDWVVSTTSGVDNCFFKAVPEYGGYVYHLTSRTAITPGANTRLLLRWKRKLYADVFRIKVSQDRSTFTEVWSAGGISGWTDQTIELGAYAGQAIYLRLEYVGGGYYLDGGVWIDSVSIQDVLNPELEGQPVHYTVLTDVVPGTYTLASVLVDAQEQEHPLSPTFTLSVAAPFTSRAESDGSVTLTGFSGGGPRLTVPAALNGKPVSGIAANAFASASGLVSVTLPASVAVLENGAFSGAGSLRRVYFTGNAPSAGGAAFSGSSATVYYLHGTTGWGATFAGRPTALWNSSILGTQALTAQGFRLTFNGPTNHLFVLEAANSLSGGHWEPVQTNLLLGPTSEFTDPSWTNAPARFYRIRTLEP